MSVVATHARVLGDTFRIGRVHDLTLISGATLFIAAMAQIAIPLPFTPVPLTLQTLAVLMTGAVLGTWRALASTSLYLAIALAGAPVLAPQADGSHITGTAVFSMASFGYVVGFMAAGALVGKLAERGFTTTPLRTALAMVAGNVVIYTFGVAVLQSVIGADLTTTISLGVTPFIIGDVLKVAIAAGILPAAWYTASKFSK